MNDVSRVYFYQSDYGLLFLVPHPSGREATEAGLSYSKEIGKRWVLVKPEVIERELGPEPQSWWDMLLRRPKVYPKVAPVSDEWLEEFISTVKEEE